MPVGLRKMEKAEDKKANKKLGSISSTPEFKLILKFLWQLENKLSDEKEVKTVHEENFLEKARLGDEKE